MRLVAHHMAAVLALWPIAAVGCMTGWPARPVPPGAQASTPTKGAKTYETTPVQYTPPAINTAAQRPPAADLANGDEYTPLNQTPSVPPTDPGIANLASFPGQGISDKPPSKDAKASAIFAPAQIVATVGDIVIEAGEISSVVDQVSFINLGGKSEAELRPGEREQLAEMKQKQFRNYLENAIQIKLVYLDFARTVPREKLSDVFKNLNGKFDAELAEWREKVNKTPKDKLARRFQENHFLTRLVILMNLRHVETVGELDLVLREFGSSLEREMRDYAETKIMFEMIRRNTKTNIEITHDEMLDYFHKHLEDYAFPAKVRWEQLSVRFDRFPSRDAAHDSIAEMGNAVYLGGAPLSAVAKKSSQEPNADQGGYHDWTNRGSLASRVLDEAIFSVPLNRLSPILEDERGYHIVRVLDRQDAGHQPFKEAQTEIKETIRQRKLNKEREQYLSRLRKITPIWSIFKDAGSVSPSDDE